MTGAALDENYRDKVLGCWIGKAIGGTLGMPFEGCPEPLDVRFEDLSGKPLPNDDLDLQLLWLCQAEQFGPAIRAEHMARAAAEHYRCFPDEYGVARWNTARGLKPPLTGQLNNWFTDGMGAAIRSEIWACLFPGRPDLAAAYAREDAVVDHHGNGVWAEMFLAAAESEAFAERQITAVLAAGLARIPAGCRLARAIGDVIAAHRNGTSWQDCRALVMKKYGSHNFTDVTVNLSFITIGLLYGQGDFERSLALAVNCGMDTDCTGATCGSLLGILLGASGLPPRWRAAANDEVAASESLKHLPLPASVTELTMRTAALAERFRPVTELSNPTPDAAGEVSDPRTWLLFHLPVEKSFTGEPGELAEAERGGSGGTRLTVDSIHLKLDPHIERPGDVLFLLTWLRVEKPLRGHLMICADTGITSWINGRQVLNYHGRRKALPAFHRTEGGGTVPVDFEPGKSYLLKIRLLGCSKPLGLSVALGDDEGRHLFPLHYEVPARS